MLTVIYTPIKHSRNLHKREKKQLQLVHEQWLLAFDCRREIHGTINIIYKMFNFVFGKLNPAAVRNMLCVCGKKRCL